MIRRFVVYTIMVLCASESYGLGFGKLELKSALNRQFQAEIELTMIRDLAAEEISVSLASQEKFDRAGIERSRALTDLRFEVVQNHNKGLVVLVTSSKPIIEPYLNFIVEIVSPGGRMMREFTVLLDPPVLSDNRVTPVQISQEDRPQALPSQPAIQSNPANQKHRLEYHVIGSGDTLWAIALRVRPNKSISVQQTMLALKRTNPVAFINDNINLLKAGYVLEIPTLNDMRVETFATAVQEVQVQNEKFRNYQTKWASQPGEQSRRSQDIANGNHEEEGELILLSYDSFSDDMIGSESVENLKEQLATPTKIVTRKEVQALRAKVQQLYSDSRAATIQLEALRAELKELRSGSHAAARLPPRDPIPVETTDPPETLFNNPVMLFIFGLLTLGITAVGLAFTRLRQQNLKLKKELEQENRLDGDGFSFGEEEEIEDDVVSEVEVHIAYGRFPQAIKLLLNAIQAGPERADIYLKLLEVYVQTKNIAAFNRQFEQMKLLRNEEANGAALVLQRNIVGSTEDTAIPMDKTSIGGEPIRTNAEPADESEAISLDVDDLEMELEFDLDADAEGLDFDLDLEFNLDTDDEDPDLEPDLDTGSEDLDLEPDLDTGNEDLDLELELDLDHDRGNEDLDLELDLDTDDENLDLVLGENNAEIQSKEPAEEKSDDDKVDKYDFDSEGIELDSSDREVKK